ncbi:MAG: SPFH domain-containing protein [Thermomicrobiales bacterium]
MRIVEVMGNTLVVERLAHAGVKQRPPKRHEPRRNPFQGQRSGAGIAELKRATWILDCSRWSSALLILIALALVAAFVSRNIIKVPPNMVAILSGRKRRVVDSQTGEQRQVGYRVIRGGSAFRIPVLERVDYISLNIISIPLRIEGAYNIEGVPVSVNAVANVKVGGDDFSVGNAIERFLGMSTAEIEEVVHQTMEGHLRSILGTLTVEELNTDRQAFAQRMTAESAQDLARMGIIIDVLTIQQISDTYGYLEALGQKRTAEVKRDAEIGRADADRDARTRAADAQRDASTAEARAEAQIAEAQRDTDVAKAQYQASINAEQARAAQAGPLAQAEAQKGVVVAQQQVEVARTEASIQVQEAEARRRERELEATVLKQADAEREAVIIAAEGQKRAAVLQAEGDQQAIVTRAEGQSRERELIGAGEGARIRQIGEAEADAQKAAAAAKRADLLAEAEGTRARLLAEAEGLRAALLAEAEGKQQLAEALNAYNDQAINLLMYQAFVEELPKMVEAAALPMSQIDRVVLIDGGGNGHGSNGDGGTLGRYAGQLPIIVQQMSENFAATTGIDLMGMVKEKMGVETDEEAVRTIIDPNPGDDD